MQTKYVLLISAVISVFFSALASIIPIWILNQGQVSSLYPTLIVPATYTFSIWSVIYLSWFVIWILAAIWKITIAKNNIILLASAQVLSSLWLIPSQFLWTGTSLIVILWVLYFLMILFYESRNESQVFKIISDLFLGWIIVASLANLHLVLASYSIYFFPIQLTIISLLAWCLLNIYFILKHNSFVPSLVLIWAWVWIMIWQDLLITQIAALISILWVLATLAYNYKSLLK